MSEPRKLCWLIETTGTQRAVWGPFSYAEAEDGKGSRYQIVGGRGLKHGKTLGAGEVQAAFQCGSIYPVTSDAEAEEALKV